MSDEVLLRHRILWIALVLVILGLMGAAIATKMKDSGPPLPVLGNVGAFSFVDQTGKTLTADELKGKVWIADFIFTRCAGTCVLMTHAMNRLNKDLADVPVTFVSFSMDPTHDTPAVLAEYAKNAGATPERWRFLTGKQEDMYRLTREDFMQAVKEEGGSPEEPILHSTRFVVVDGKGRIRGFYSGTEAEAQKKLIDDVRRLTHSKRDLD